MFQCRRKVCDLGVIKSMMESVQIRIITYRTNQKKIMQTNQYHYYNFVLNIQKLISNRFWFSRVIEFMLLTTDQTELSDVKVNAS